MINPTKLSKAEEELVKLQAALAAAGIAPANAVAGLEELVAAKRSAGKTLLTLRSENGLMQERIKVQDGVTQVLVDQLLDLQQRQGLIIDLLSKLLTELADNDSLAPDQFFALFEKVKILK